MTLRSTSCRWESQVVRAAQEMATQTPAHTTQAHATSSPAAAAARHDREPLDPRLAAHVAACASCRELFDVARAMRRLAQETQAEAAAHPLPAAGRIWWKAQLVQRWEAEARATAPVDLMQRAEIIGGLLAGLALVLTLWPDLRKFEGAPSSAQQWWPALARLFEPSTFTTLVIGAGALLCLLALLTLRQVLADD